MPKFAAPVTPMGARVALLLDTSRPGRAQIARSFPVEYRCAQSISDLVVLRSGQARAASLLIAALVLGVVGFGFVAMRKADAQPPGVLTDAANASILVPPPLILRKVEPEQAFAINERIPMTRSPNPAAKEFKFQGEKLAFNNAVECLTAAVYYEAGSETSDGQRAVAQVVLNRVRHPAFPSSICDVVYQGSARITGCQFTFTCDGAICRIPDATRWTRAREVAEAALKGAVYSPVGYATHYHANYVVPYWASSLSKKAVVGSHIFYQWAGWWGTPPAFSQRHLGSEVNPLREAALKANCRDVAPIGTGETPLTVTTDPRVELVSVVQVLASRSLPSVAETSYHTAVRQHFSRFSNHLAVQIYRQFPAKQDGQALDLSVRILMHFSPPPRLRPRRALDPGLVNAAGGPVKLAGFLSALRDFSSQTNFEAFYGARQAFYAELSRASTTRLIGDDTDRSELGTIIVAPLLQTSMLFECHNKHDRHDPQVVIGLAGAPLNDRSLGRKQREKWLQCLDGRSASERRRRFRSGR